MDSIVGTRVVNKDLGVALIVRDRLGPHIYIKLTSFRSLCCIRVSCSSHHGSP